MKIKLAFIQCLTEYIHIKKIQNIYSLYFFIFNLFDQSSFKMELDVPLNPENLNMN